MNTLIELLKIGGGIAGIIALLWRFVDELGMYLRMSLTVKCLPDGILATATVDNKSSRAKRLDNALLLIGPEDERPLETADALVPELLRLGYPVRTRFTSTNQIAELKIEEFLYFQERAMIPLHFFYDENIDIADETLSYAAPLDLSKLGRGKPYAVRFFIHAAGYLHRSTEDTFFMPT